MTTTKLYLDVDGVINVFPKQNRNKTGWEDIARSSAAGYTVTWSPQMIEELASLGLDLVWTTMWLEHAAERLAPVIEFGRGARHLTPPEGMRAMWPTIDWKFQAVRLDQKSDPSPFLWIDDEIAKPHRLWALENGGMAFRPNETQGITPGIIRDIREFLGLEIPELEAVEEAV